MTVCVEVLHNVTTRQQQQQQPLEAGRQIIFQKGVAWTNEPARGERDRERAQHCMYVMINKAVNVEGDPNDLATV
jgi:hypothetical protein